MVRRFKLRSRQYYLNRHQTQHVYIEINNPVPAFCRVIYHFHTFAGIIVLKGDLVTIVELVHSEHSEQKWFVLDFVPVVRTVRLYWRAFSVLTNLHTET